jgi:RNA polymerase sigma factor (sigma-70 family)
VNVDTEFNAFFTNYYREVVRHVMYLGGSKEEAEDAAATAFLATYQRWNDIGEHGAYTKVAARNAFLRLRAGTPRFLAANDFPELCDHAAKAELDAWEEQEWVEEVLSSLTSAQRATMRLLLDGLSRSEIAVTLGKTPGAVRKMLLDARQRLRPIVEVGVGGTGTASTPTVEDV